MKKELTQDRLKEVIHYDPSTGFFTWKKRKPGRRLNKNAGCFSNEYLLIRIDYELHKAQRLAFLYMNGKWPIGIIDHKDRNPSNNKWSNLREVNHSINANNTYIRSNNKSGCKGVWLDKRRNKWVAEIKINYKKKFLGRFDNKEDAINERKKAEKTFILS